MMSLNYYLSRSAHGDNIAAYEAAKIMHFEKYSEVMVQAQLRKAASLGNVNAMRWLGFLGLSGNLISPESTITKITYYNTYDQAYNWFVEGSEKGDALSLFVVGTCLQYGIGTSQDVQKSEIIISKVLESISMDVIVMVVFLINTIHSSTTLNSKSFSNDLIEKILGN